MDVFSVWSDPRLYNEKPRATLRELLNDWMREVCQEAAFSME
jgi:hypothetical protein